MCPTLDRLLAKKWDINFMYIQTEETPNPNSLKFLPGKEVLKDKYGKSLFFESKDDAKNSPLAQKLFDNVGVKAVFLGPDFITVTKDDNEDWFVLKPGILGSIMEHYVNKHPVMIGDDESTDTQSSAAQPSDESVDDDPIIRQIKAILDTRVRPMVAMDGGDITFDSFKDGIVYLELKGACSGCPSSSATLKSGVENLLKYYVPEVLEVRPVNEG